MIVNRDQLKAMAEATALTRAGRLAEATALTPYFFDLLHLDGDDLIDLPGR